MSVVALQIAAGAYGSELSDPDEPAHFISGLLVRDYLAGGMPGSPLTYARDYYAHYPKVAIGNWPPLFHAVQGVWLLATPDDLSSVLVLVALFTAATAWLIYLVLHRSLDTVHAAFGAGLFITMRPVPAYAGAVMIEMMLVLMTTIAAWLFVLYLDGLRLRQAAAFGAACVLAVLTKGNALLLALLPPFAVLIGGRWAAFRRRSIWIAAMLVVLIAGPWTWYFLSTAQAGWLEALPTAEFMKNAGVYYLRGPYRSLGWVCLSLAAIGVWARLIRPGARRDDHATVWICAAALFVAVIVFNLLVPAGTGLRHLIPAYPALVMFTAAGAFWSTTALQRRGPRRAMAAATVLGLATTSFFLESFRMPHKTYDGYGDVAAALLDRVAAGDTVASMIISNATGEGSYIAEMAMRDRNRPSHTVWRGTNLLSTATWAGRDYRLRASDEEGVIRLLEQASVRFIIIDRTARRFRHHEQVERTIAAHPDRFRLIDAFPVRKETGLHDNALVVYELQPGPDWMASAPARIRQIPGYEGIEGLR